MKEIDYDGPSLRESSAWEKRYAQNKAAQGPLLRTPSAENGVSQRNPLPPRRSMYEDVLKHKIPERPLPPHESHEEMPLGKIIFGLLLVLAFGLGVGAYVLIGTKSDILGSAPENVPTVPQVTNEDANIMLSDSPRTQVLADIAILFNKTSLPKGERRAVHFLIKGNGEMSRPATVKEFLQAINKFPGADVFVRSLDTPFTYDIVSDAGLVGNITLLSRSYPNTFAAMLDWETSMPYDLLPVLHPEFTQNKLKEIEGRTFHDERIGTIDVRVLYDALGNVLIAYGFIDPKTLIISGGKGAFASTTLPAVTQ